jgi:hypothetical protein
LGLRALWKLDLDRCDHLIHDPGRQLLAFRIQVSIDIDRRAWFGVAQAFRDCDHWTSVLNISETAMCLKSKPCSNSPCIWRSQASVLVFITKVRLNRWSQLRVVRVCQCPLWTFGDRTFISKADVFWHFLISLSFQREGGRQTCITSVENVKFEPPRLKVA